MKEKTAEERKIKKQKTVNEKRGKLDLKLKRKNVSYDESTSEDSDLKIEYAESGDSFVEEEACRIDEDLLEGKEKTIELSLDKKNKRKGITKRQKRQPKRQRTHSHRDTSDSEMDVPLMKLIESH